MGYILIEDLTCVLIIIIKFIKEILPMSFIKKVC